MRFLTPILAALAITFVMISYVVAYLRMGEFDEFLGMSRDGRDGPNIVLRIYRYEWAPLVFAPAAWVENKMSGKVVKLKCEPKPRLVE